MDLVAQNVFFYAIAAMMVYAAIRVVMTRNIVHAALWLILVLAGAAGQFILLVAEFTAVVQVLVYIGAIVVLFLFGIMLTRAPLGDSLELDRAQMIMGAVVALPLLVLLGYTLIDSWGDEQVNFDAATTQVEAAANVDETAAAEDVDNAETADEATSVEGAEPQVGDDSETVLEPGEEAAASTGAIVDPSGSNTKAVSDSIFRDYLIPFEAVSVLLLAALMGAIVLARRD
jgi:NADH-quinone oxidoreductase subunit J